MKRLFFYLFLILLLTSSALAHGQKKTVIVNMDDGFDPAQIKIVQGDTVKFINNGESPAWPASDIHPTHQIYPDFDPKKPILPGKIWSFEFDRAGEWRFHNHLKPELVGKVIVVADPDFEPPSKPNNRNFIAKLKDVFVSIFIKIKDYILVYQEVLKIKEDSKEIFKSDISLLAYIKKFGPIKTIDRLDQLQGEFGDCHQRAHKAGRLAFEIYGNKVFSNREYKCHSGLQHGAIEAFFHKFGTSSLNQNVKEFCNAKEVSFISHQCFHGIGHGLMAWSNYDLPQALEKCDLLSLGQSSCYTGVFMENVVGGLAAEEKSKNHKSSLDVHYTNYLNSEPLYPCTIVEGKYRQDCYFYQTSRMLQLFGPDFSKIADSCLSIPQTYQTSCFLSMGRDASGQHQSNLPAIIKDCDFATGDHQTDCIIGAVQDQFWDKTGANQGLEFCKLLTKPGQKKVCYINLLNRAKELLTKHEAVSYCNSFEEAYRFVCRN